MGFSPTEVADWPSPVVAWPSAPLEVRVAFEKPLAVERASALVDQHIEFGSSSRTSSSIVPTRGVLRIAASRLADEGRTLILATDPHPFDATYSLPFNGDRQATRPERASYNLTGVEASWSRGSENEEPLPLGWWPTLEIDQARRETKGSAEHARAFGYLNQPGRLTLRGLLAAVEGTETLRLTANVPFQAALGPTERESRRNEMGLETVEFALEASGFPEELIVELPTGTTLPTMRATLLANGVEGPLPRRGLLVPWAPITPTISEAPFEAPYPLEGGDPDRGKTVFFSEAARCATCHQVAGQGGMIGPDLTHPRQRDIRSIYRAIAAPSDEIHPEFVPYTIATSGGQVAVGVVRAEGSDAIKVLDTDGKVTLLKRSEIQLFQPSGTSIMPVGLAGALGEQGMRDLLAYLLKSQPEGR
jgi:putative heme-binding domain-containing protein